MLYGGNPMSKWKRNMRKVNDEYATLQFLEQKSSFTMVELAGN